MKLQHTKNSQKNLHRTQKDILEKWWIFALGSAPTTSTSGQPSKEEEEEEEETPEYSQSGYAQTNISFPVSEIKNFKK